MKILKADALPRIACTVVAALTGTTTTWAGDHDNDHHRPPVRLSIDAPDSGHFEGLTTNTGWSLVLRIEAPHSIALVETPEELTQPIGRREAIVLTDPDGCLDMRHFPITNAGRPY